MPVSQKQTRNKTDVKTSPVTAKFTTTEPVGYTSRLRAVGNSKGVILNNRVIKTAGLRPEADIIVEARDGMIIIVQAKMADPDVNTDISTWDKQFKAAIRKGKKPERDMFGGIENDFDKTEW